MGKKILVIDDERAIRNSLKEILGFEGYDVETLEDGAAAIAFIRSDQPVDCVLCDIKMPKADGMEVLDAMISERPDTPIVMISGHGTIDVAVEAVKKGAYDYLSKPPDLNRLLITIKNATEKLHLIRETKTLKKKIAKRDEIIGQTAAILEILDMVEKVAPTDARVLITGSNGSGKELIAQRIHNISNRSHTDMVEVNCAAIPSELIESELFGHEKGSFTSAIKQRVGKFEQADGGTLFLDEVADMSLSAQAKVLRVLQEGKLTRVGGEKEIKVNVRVIAATNKDLKAEIAKGNFREDLYHRLGVVLINVPSLNERRDDIPLLISSFLEDICEEYRVPVKDISGSAMQLLKEYDWTGNIRELKNVVERLVIFSDHEISQAHVEKYILIK